MKEDFVSVEKFERTIADFFGAPYAVATDCCTNAIELSLRISNQSFETKTFSNISPRLRTNSIVSGEIKVPVYTYLSVPFMLKKNNWEFKFTDEEWVGYYHLTERVVDAAVYWKRDGYVPGTLMCISFFRKKHLSTDRGGIILLDNKDDYEHLIKLTYDGRDRTDTPYYKQKINMGYHYNMTNDKAELGLKNFEIVKDKEPDPRRKWDWYSPITEITTVFENEDIIPSTK